MVHLKQLLNKKDFKYSLGGILLITGCWFSYQPLLHFGSAAGANIELSLTHIFIAVFITAITYLFFKKRPEKIAIPLPYILLVALALFSTLSLAWTPNLTRGILVTGLLWAIVALWLALTLYYPAVKSKESKKYLINALFIGAIGVSVFGWFQIFGEGLGLPLMVTLLPEPYTSAMFGFARPTAFALEPQFLGSLLFVPILIALYFEIKSKGSPLSRTALFLALLIFVATISRGAFIGLVLGIIVLFATNYRQSKNILKIISALLLSLLVSVSLTALAAHMNQRDEISAKQAVIKSINQVSIGLIDIPLSETNAVQQPVNLDVEQALPPQPVDNGYVAESTNSRLLMSQEAINLWSQNPATVLFGIGAGGFGAALNEKNETYSIRSIVNNQYLETLSELGIVGFVLLVSLLLTVVIKSIMKKAWLILAISSAFYTQALFFSGNVNILHFWIFLGVALLFLSKKSNQLSKQY